MLASRQSVIHSQNYNTNYKSWNVSQMLICWVSTCFSQLGVQQLSLDKQILWTTVVESLQKSFRSKSNQDAFYIDFLTDAVTLTFIPDKQQILYQSQQKNTKQTYQTVS